MGDEYRELKRVNISNLKHIKKSPLAYKWNLEHPQADKPAWVFGRAVHCAVFEPARFESDYCAWLWGKRVGAKYAEFVESHKGVEVMTADDYAEVVAIRDVVRGHPLVAPYLSAGEAEARILWTDVGSGLKCKGRADFISTSKPSILDLKTTRDLKWFQNDCAKFLYHCQAGFYVDGVADDPTRGQDLPFTMVAVETNPPYDVGVFTVSGESLDAGRFEYARMLDTLKHCIETDTWPGAFEFEQELILPKWALGADEELELTMDGESIDI